MKPETHPLSLPGRLAGIPLAAVAAGLVALGVAGCREGTNTLTMTRGMEGAETVEVDGKLAKLARVTEVVESERNGLLNVQARVENTTGRDQNILYQWVWYEGDFEVDGLSARKTFNLEAREVETIRGVAPNPRVDGYALRLNRAVGD